MKSKSIRVAMIAPPWLPVPPKGYGGIENVVAPLVRALLDIGVQVELFTVGESTLKSTKNHSLFEKGQFEHIYGPQYESLPITAAHLLYAQRIIEEDGHFDVVHDHCEIIGPLVLGNTGHHLPPVLHTFHNPFRTLESTKEGAPDSSPMWGELATSKNIHFVTQSRSLDRHVPKPLRKLMLPPVHNAIDTNEFEVVMKKEDYFIQVSRFHPTKGQDIAVRACLDLDAQLKLVGIVANLAQRKKVLLELANPLSPYRNLLTFRYFSDKIFPFLDDEQIKFYGDLALPQKQRLTSHAKGFLLPIQWEEPFGMVAIEALAYGTPVVAMKRGALPEIITHGKNGFLAKNYREFKMYMKRVGEIDPAACRASVEQKFSAPVMARNYVERYRQILAKKV